MRRIPIVLTTSILLWLISCGVVPRRVSLDDPSLQPLLKALDRSDRLALGFTPIKPSDDIRLEGATRQYDAMLHVYGQTSRTIAFAREGGQFVWIGEQESHKGPHEYETVDGILREELVLTYETRPISGVPLNTLAVTYHGDDPTLSWPHQLTPLEARVVLDRWRHPPRQANVL
jgi:hypothetical protein